MREAICWCFSFHMIDFTWHNVGHWKGPVGWTQPIWNFTQVWNGNSCSASRGHEHFTQTNDTCGGRPSSAMAQPVKGKIHPKTQLLFFGYSFNLRQINCDLLSWVTLTREKKCFSVHKVPFSSAGRAKARCFSETMVMTRTLLVRPVKTSFSERWNLLSCTWHSNKCNWSSIMVRGSWWMRSGEVVFLKTDVMPSARE